MIKKIFCVMAVMASMAIADAGFNTTQNHNSDGYIYKGTITLRRLSSGIRDTFYLFNKEG